jgi:hypothetical protein
MRDVISIGVGDKSPWLVLLGLKPRPCVRSDAARSGFQFTDGCYHEFSVSTRQASSIGREPTTNHKLCHHTGDVTQHDRHLPLIGNSTLTINSATTLMTSLNTEGIFHWKGTSGFKCPDGSNTCPGLWAVRCGSYKLHYVTSSWFGPGGSNNGTIQNPPLIFQIDKDPGTVRVLSVPPPPATASCPGSHAQLQPDMHASYHRADTLHCCHIIANQGENYPSAIYG